MSSESTTVYEEIAIGLDYQFRPGARATRSDPGYAAETDIETFSLAFGGGKLGAMLTDADLTPDGRAKLRAYLSERYAEEMAADVSGPDPDYARDLAMEG